MKTAVCALTLALGFAAAELRAQGEPNLIPDVVDPAKLMPILPEPPAGWTAEKAEGSRNDVGEFKITNVHADYPKGEDIDVHPAFEAYEKDQKQASLWVMVAKRYFVEVQLQNQDPKELQEWIKRVDLKKLAEIKK